MEYFVIDSDLAGMIEDIVPSDSSEVNYDYENLIGLA